MERGGWDSATSSCTFTALTVVLLHRQLSPLPIVMSQEHQLRGVRAGCGNETVL